MIDTLPLYSLYTHMMLRFANSYYTIINLFHYEVSGSMSSSFSIFSISPCSNFRLHSSGAVRLLKRRFRVICQFDAVFIGLDCSQISIPHRVECLQALDQLRFVILKRFSDVSSSCPVHPAVFLFFLFRLMVFFNGGVEGFGWVAITHWIFFGECVNGDRVFHLEVECVVYWALPFLMIIVLADRSVMVNEGMSGGNNADASVRERCLDLSDMSKTQI